MFLVLIFIFPLVKLSKEIHVNVQLHVIECYRQGNRPNRLTILLFDNRFRRREQARGIIIKPVMLGLISNPNRKTYISIPNPSGPG